ncbi:MAG: YbdK family carboxylate-amine ligase [Actinobacteria bacterium]|nr:MAG: YbdK family carboxylate-amine ligase [Actinomycetota bacterium]
MIEAHFGERAPFSVGVEEELMVLDGESLALAPRAAAIIGAAEDTGLTGTLKSELFASALELNTGICDSPEQAAEALAELRRSAGELARERGLRLAAAGSHPISRPDEQEIADEQRYLEFVEYAGISARRQGVSGLHVHVGMASPDACFQALEGVLPWLPVVLAISVNSPYLAGEETGLLSNRAEVLAQLPRTGAPPAFRSYAEWEEFVELFMRLRVADDYTRFWWDIRPHPRLGTLEIRMPDQPTTLERTAELVSLLRGLCEAVLEQPADHDPAARGFYQQNRWAASRFGLAAELIHPDGKRTAPASELAAELADLAGASKIDVSRTEADRQLEVGRAQGLQAVCADLVERTVS